MKHWTLACLLGAALLTACASSDDTKNPNGSGGTSGYGAGGPGGPGDPNGGNGYGAGGAGRGAPGSQEDLTQSAGDRIFFDTDRNTLNPQATATLDRQSAWLQQYPQVNVWVAGNCDERGTEEYNLAQLRKIAANRFRFHARGLGTRSKCHHLSAVIALIFHTPAR